MGLPGNSLDGSDEGQRARGSFYKSIKSASTSSLDLLGTLATSISRENLVSFGAGSDNSNALSSFGGDLPSGAFPQTHKEEAPPATLKRNSESIQNFWMLVEMGDLSRPYHDDLDLQGGGDDMDSAVFDNEEEKADIMMHQQLYMFGEDGSSGISNTTSPMPMISTSAFDQSDQKEGISTEVDSSDFSSITQSAQKDQQSDNPG